MSDLRAADVVARRLYEAGCRYAFGIPGGEVLTLIDAIEAAGIHFVLVKHENSGGFMAEGIWHLTGAPGILIATVGPGVLNTVNVAGNAEQDRVPLVILSGCVDADDALTYTHQVLDHQAVLAPVTKATFRLTPSGADTVIEKALSIATEARPGPVLVDVPISVADARCPVDRPRRIGSSGHVAPAPGDDLRLARTWIEESTRPVMIAGLDAVRDNASDEIRAFAEDLGVPLITTYKAKGILPEDHPMAVGGAGLSPKADSRLLPFLREADLILCAGYDPIEMRTGWRDAWDPRQQRVIEIAAVANRHFMHQASISFVAETRAGLRTLREGLAPKQTWPDGEVGALREDLVQDLLPNGEWGPAAVVADCRDVLPRNTIATADSGAHRILLSQAWRCFEPSTLLQSSGLCTMGCAVPLAIGAKIAAPDRPVVSFSGDAGLLMVAGELATTAELGLPVIFVVFVDRSLALIELKQRQRQLPNVGVDFENHDFAAIGRSFGGNGFTVTNSSELRLALTDALSSDRFSVIAAVIDRKGYDGLI
ncbi:MAG: thiamine pyrophosphate-binding protein [Pseudomonadota bacterium]